MHVIFSPDFRLQPPAPLPITATCVTLSLGSKVLGTGEQYQPPHRFLPRLRVRTSPRICRPFGIFLFLYFFETCCTKQPHNRFNENPDHMSSFPFQRLPLSLQVFPPLSVETPYFLCKAKLHSTYCIRNPARVSIGRWPPPCTRQISRYAYPGGGVVPSSIFRNNSLL